MRGVHLLLAASVVASEALWASPETNVELPDWVNHPLQVRALGDGWFEAEGEAQVVNITPEEAQRGALQDARERAIMSAVGIDVRAQTFLRQEETPTGIQAAFLSLSEQTSAGRIVDELSPEWTSYQLPAEPLPILVYRATVRVRVEREEGQADPDFSVKVIVNKERFSEGDEMRLAITATRRCYVTVLCVSATDTVIVLLPHKYRQDRLLAPGDTLWIPDADEQAMGIRYRAVLPAGRVSVTEMIKVVATKQPHAFGQGLEMASIYNQVPTRQAALVELMRWLVEIPRNQRAEAQAVYEVKAVE